ncbi:MAG: helix-turn-helix transcriptional regulator [Lachnospiraceae bacterium]|nr:helix-turn-helix transcriptional regulator [Lachnospiraceae bacterium]
MRLNKTKLLFILAEKEMKQSEVATACGMSKGNFSVIVSGKRCRPETAGKIAKALGVPVSEIFDVD